MTELVPSVNQDGFDDVLQACRRSLTLQEQEKFETTTRQDVEAAIRGIQSKQEAQREMMDMTRLQAFLEKMSQFSEIMDTFSLPSSYLNLICWGPMLFMLRSAETHKDALDKVLDAYSKIGERMPSLRPYKLCFEQAPATSKFLQLMSSELSEFHCQKIRCLDHPNLRQLFRSFWNDSKKPFAGIVERLDTQRRFIEGQSATASSDVAESTQNFFFNFVSSRQVCGNNYESVRVEGGNALLGNVSSGGQVSFNRGSDPIDLDQLAVQLEGLEISLADAKKGSERQERERQEAQKLALTEWLAGSEAAEHHEEVYCVHKTYPDTGSWILHNDKVVEWLHDDLPHRPILWIHGMPGAGKTVLASVIIEKCKQLSDSDTMYFYCRHDDDETRTSISILKGLLLQALDSRPRFRAYFDEQKSRLGEPVLRSESAAKKLFDIVCRSGKRLYIVLDGLDECRKEERESLLRYMNSLFPKLGQDDLGNLRLLIISQRVSEIRKCLPDVEELVLESSHNQGDIDIYVSHRVAEIKQKFGINADQVDILKNRICWKASGQFLYAKLLIEHFLNQPQKLELQRELASPHFPQTLPHAYRRILGRIRESCTPKEWQHARRLLGWMVCAARPLKWHEMQGAICIDTTHEEVNFDGLQLRCSLEELCGALVSVRKNRVSLVHSTAKEFIQDSEVVDIQEVECELLALSLHYLSFECFSDDLEDDEFSKYFGAGYFAFADYAAAKWTYHFYRFISRAQSLSQSTDLPQKAGAVRRLCEAIEYFAQEYEDDLEVSRARNKEEGLSIRLHPAVVQLLDACKQAEIEEYIAEGEVVDDMYEPGTFDMVKPLFERVYVHLELQNKDSRNRHIFTLDRIRKAFDRIRKAMEESVDQIEQEADLATFYGDRMFKCSKTTCFYFHEGFKSKKIRDKHEGRHDRPWNCDEPDCTAGEFGFSSKIDLEKHRQSYHPDLELKAKKFADVKPKATGTKKWLCTVCGSSFARNNILKDHMLTHSGQKPHECSICGKAFTRKNDCTRHEKTRHDS